MTVREWGFVVASGLLALAALSLVFSALRYRRFLSVPGRVIAVEIETFDGEPSYYVRFGFRDSTGREITGRSTGRRHAAPYAEGQELRVLYDPADPSTSRIATFRETYATPLTFVAMGLVVAVVGLMFR